MDLTPEERLWRRIAKDPQDIAAYTELSQIFLDTNRFKEAEEVLNRAYEASHHDIDVRDRLVDAQVRGLKFKLRKAEDEAETNESEENKAEVKRCEKEFNQILLLDRKHRAERYPSNLSIRLELGMQYMVLDDYGEAIKQFQVARNDPRREGFCLLMLGECFKRLKQNRLAMEHFEAAIQEIPDKDADNKKKALYRAGALAAEIGDVTKAETYLKILASMDPSFRLYPFWLARSSPPVSKRNVMDAVWTNLGRLAALRFLPPRWRLTGFLAVGVVAGAGLFVVHISRAASYLGDSPETCMNCHVMATQYVTWQHSSHGRVATCNDCHVPHNSLLTHYAFKAKDGLWHATVFTMRWEPQAIRLSRGAVPVVEENCRRCHAAVLQDVCLAAHRPGDLRCWECHRETPHGRVRSLAAAPGVLQPQLPPVRDPLQEPRIGGRSARPE